ncbi:ABC transporter permease [Actinomadura sp. 7K507]|uniref:ABC transporter permease n=1 Tax=Actinomadura sp. 7K507 TaxID=2530365 RepID=UPI001050D142|nr:ABC transporter permease [Actinomadura sp. 7K507]TDC90208.1 ABC transporter permease [Actinomadura sp. 7K507]
MRRIPLKMIAGRLVAIPVSLFAVATLAFWMIRLSGTNAAASVAGEHATPEAIAATERELGLDRGLWDQYLSFLGGLVRGDLGTSYFTRQPVGEELMARLPLDATVGVLALIVAVAAGVGIGAAGAWYRGGWPDRTGRGVVTLLQSVPEFVLALVLIFVLFFQLRLLPAPVGQIELTQSAPPRITGVVALDAIPAGDWAAFRAAAAQLVLPVVSFGLVLSAVFAKVTRSSLASVLASPQVEYARALGLPSRRVFSSALTVSRTAILTTIAIVSGALIGGNAIMQKIFSLDGAAAFGVDSIFKLDLPVVQGLVLVFGGITVVLFLLIDIMILLLDPRVRATS